MRDGVGEWMSAAIAGHDLSLHPCELYAQICESPAEMLGDEGAGSLKKMENL